MTTLETSTPKPTSVWLSFWIRLKEDRGGRAQLARCGTVTEAAFCAPFHLLRRMKGNPTREMDLQKLGLIATVLAHVDLDEPSGNLARLMASSQGDKAVVSDVRFRQLLRSEPGDLDERLAALMRVIRQLGRKAPVHRLAEDLWWWNEKTKRQWALDYYEAAPQPEKSSD